MHHHSLFWYFKTDGIGKPSIVYHRTATFITWLIYLSLDGLGHERVDHIASCPSLLISGTAGVTELNRLLPQQAKLYWDLDGAWRSVLTEALCKQLQLMFSKSLLMCSLPGYVNVHLSVTFWFVAITRENVYYHLQWNIYTHTGWVCGVKYVKVYIAHTETNKLKGMFWDIWQR